jgi:hypothetical protein
MKWYKKQMDKLKTKKSEFSSSDKEVAPKKNPSHSFGLKNNWESKKSYPSPVAASKKSRLKTDIH